MGEVSGDESGGATSAVVIEDDDDHDDDGSGGDGNNSGGNDQLDDQNVGNQVVSDIPENEDVVSDSGDKNGNSGNEPEGEPSPASPVPATQVVQEPSFAEALLEDSLMFGGDEDDDLPPLPAPPVDPAEDDSEYEKFTPEDKALPFVPSESNSKVVNKNTESELRKLQDRVNILKKERTALLLI